MNEENLKPFKKGIDPRRNLKGPAKKLPELNELMAKVMGELGEGGLTAMEAIIKAQRIKAARGDTKAAELLLDRAYGKARQHIDHTTKDKEIQPINIAVLSDVEQKELGEIARKLRQSAE